MIFEWDELKAEANNRKHGVSFAEAASVFIDPLALSANDPRHSQDEDRFIIMGQSDRGRLLIISYTERGDATRLISAREATRHQRKDYENGNFP